MPKPKTHVDRVPEHVEQTMLFRWATEKSATIPELGLLFSIPNGGYHLSKRARKFLGDEGRTAGIPDICLPVARQGKHGLWIELKAIDGSASKQQKDWIKKLNEQGYQAEICHGCRKAQDVLAQYLGFELSKADLIMGGGWP